MLNANLFRYLIIVGGMAVAFGGTWAVTSYLKPNGNTSNPPKSAPADTALKNSKNDTAATLPASPPSAPPTDSSPKSPPAQTPPAPTLAVTITNASQQSTYIAIRALVNGTASGTCFLELSKSGQSTMSRQALLVVQANYVTCQGFNVALSDFPVSGQWTALIKVESPSGAAQSQPVSVNVQK